MFEPILSKQMKFMEFEKLLNDAGMVALVPCVIFSPPPRCVNGTKRQTQSQLRELATEAIEGLKTDKIAST